MGGAGLVCGEGCWGEGGCVSGCDCDCFGRLDCCDGKGCDIYDCRLHMSGWAVGVAFW